ncbi:unnamed protein product, partial [Prunus brigantina]
MELTRTRKGGSKDDRTFLSNENNVQILPETNSAAAKGKEPQKPPRAEQAIFHSQKMLKTKSPDKLHRNYQQISHERLCFSKPTKEMANHLGPLFITANFGGVPVPKVMVDGGAAINLLPYGILSKMGEREGFDPNTLDRHQLRRRHHQNSWDPRRGCYSWKQRAEDCILCGRHYFHHLQCIAWRETGFIESMCSFHSPSQ